MKKTHRDEEEKKLLKLYREYMDTRDSRKEHGRWVDVDPYQKGWVRFYVLRDDAKNRTDTNRLRRVLELVNYSMYSDREDFTRSVWKNGRKQKTRIPIEQPLGWLTEKKYNELPDDIRKYFVRTTWTEKRTYPTKHYITLVGYVPTTPEYFVFLVEPNMIVQHFIPDGEWESRMSELWNKIDRNFLWPKIEKAMGRSFHNGYRLMNYGNEYAKNKYGMTLSKEDLDYDDAD